MAKSIIASKKPKGRPVTGVGIPVQVRFHPDNLEGVDDWRKQQADLPGRAEAIRRLVEMALKAKPGK